MATAPWVARSQEMRQARERRDDEGSKIAADLAFEQSRPAFRPQWVAKLSEKEALPEEASLDSLARRNSGKTCATKEFPKETDAILNHSFGAPEGTAEGNMPRLGVVMAQPVGLDLAFYPVMAFPRRQTQIGAGRTGRSRELRNQRMPESVRPKVVHHSQAPGIEIPVVRFLTEPVSEEGKSPFTFELMNH